MSTTLPGICDKCKSTFEFRLIHNGFNESSYVYCDSCGKTSLLDEYSKQMPGRCEWFFRSDKRYEKIDAKLEPYLEKCLCGGSFKRSAIPRCPRCKQQLDPVEVNKYIDNDRPVEDKGKFLWQNNWDGIYAIIIEENVIRNNWRTKK